VARYAARLAYDGTSYVGFQRQAAGLPTVQQVVEDALSSIARRSITILGAGRTDSGVHASGQVIAFDIEWAHPDHALLKAVNAHLPPDVALQAIMQAADDFHPRFDAKCRRYLYRILITPHRDPLRRQVVWHWRSSLDMEAMQRCAQLLIGEHDFATFGQPPQGENTVRHVTEADPRMVSDELHFTISANAFLQRMVRSIVGTLVEVGRGKISVEEFVAAFRSADRALSGPSAPPQGLTLMQVVYDSDVDQLFA
jgi:tRNA pseudouridine38-40 synthase